MKALPFRAGSLFVRTRDNLVVLVQTTIPVLAHVFETGPKLPHVSEPGRFAPIFVSPGDHAESCVIVNLELRQAFLEFLSPFGSVRVGLACLCVAQYRRGRLYRQ